MTLSTSSNGRAVALTTALNFHFLRAGNFPPPATFGHLTPADLTGAASPGVFGASPTRRDICFFPQPTMEFAYNVVFSSVHGEAIATVLEPFYMSAWPLEERRATWLVGIGSAQEAVPGLEFPREDYLRVADELGGFLKSAGCLSSIESIASKKRE